MDFTLTPELAELQVRIKRFIADEVMPFEADPRQGAHGPDESLREALIDKARQAGLLSPHAAHEYGGLGLSHVGRAVAFEEAGYSMLGPVALNIFAPDEGNMHLLEAVATAEQKEQWLRPMAEGRIRSCFCMTEPAPGAGSDPSMMTTTAVLDADANGRGDHYVINGHKWFITGADGAALAIIMAKVPDVGATMFLADMGSPGITLERNMDTLDTCFPGGHGVLTSRACACRRRPSSASLGKASATRRCGCRPRA